MILENLQNYWWLLISILGGILVFLLFVQGGQSMIFSLGNTDERRNKIIGAMGSKWELTFTTLVTFGGAFFASFPLFYSTSFGGAYWLWILIFLWIQPKSLMSSQQFYIFDSQFLHTIQEIINQILQTAVIVRKITTAQEVTEKQAVI